MIVQLQILKKANKSDNHNNEDYDDDDCDAYTHR